MKDKVTLTRAGLELLEAELYKLEFEDRPEVLKEIEEARAFGDLSENADYSAARSKQEAIEKRISEIRAHIKNSQIVELSTSAKSVQVGNYVKVRDKSSNEEFAFQILGQFEGKPLAGTISIDAPLAVAIIGKTEGESAIVKATNPYEVEILAISIEKI